MPAQVELWVKDAFTGQNRPLEADDLGGADTGAFGYETLTVSTAAVGPTASVYAPTGQEAARVAIISVESNGIRFRYDGGEPTATEGHALAAGTTYELPGADNVAQLRMIRSGGADATVHITYER